ncbi:MAG: pyridoxamine 5'-phosphate oxidase family protein [Flavobacteriaceae bacterium]|jgi:general stress protein 26
MLRLVVFILFFKISFGQEYTPEEYKSIALEIINDADFSVLTTTENNQVDTRTMDHFNVGSDFVLYFGTNVNSRKVKQIQKNKNVTVHFNSIENDGYVSVKGHAYVNNDSVVINKYWKDDWNIFYPDKSNYRVLKVIINSFELISEKHNILGDSLTWKSPMIKLN